MDRVILHCDLNAFYASVECLYHPEYRNVPVAVGGDVERRHGIILAKNQLAKGYQIQTGEPLWQARQKCPQLVILPPDFRKYLYFSQRVREIFLEYTERVEPFGIDEAWLDVTESQKLFGNGQQIADTLRERIKRELGITASVGVSYNKIFAKLGSDYKKPDATTVIDRANKKKIVDCLPVEDLLNVGRSTRVTLKRYGIDTIGDLANQDLEFMRRTFGKNGEALWRSANGLDHTPVRLWTDKEAAKSIGNSTTTCKDITSYQEAEIVLYVLAESVAARMREQHVVCRKVGLSLRDIRLRKCSRQCALDTPTQSAKEIWERGMSLLRKRYTFDVALRSIGIKAMELMPEGQGLQLSLFQAQEDRDKQVELEKTVEQIRDRYGFQSIKRGLMLKDLELSGFNPHRDHVIHPQGFTAE